MLQCHTVTQHLRKNVRLLSHYVHNLRIPKENIITGITLMILGMELLPLVENQAEHCHEFGISSLLVDSCLWDGKKM